MTLFLKNKFKEVYGLKCPAKMSNISNIEFFEDALKNNKILKAKGKIARFNEDTNQEILILNLKNATLVIPSEEMDLEKKWDRLNGFIGRDLKFVVTQIKDNYILCSRKKAQQILIPKLIEDLKRGNIFPARIVNPQKYGAYVEVDNVLTGIMKNSDFAENHITVKEVLQKGDIVNVRLKKLTNNGKVNFEAVEKYKPKTMIDISNFQIDDIVEGKLKTIQPDKCFVNIAPGVDALCSIPIIGDLYEDMSVVIKISKLDENTQKVRGKIIEVKRPREF